MAATWPIALLLRRLILAGSDLDGCGGTTLCVVLPLQWWWTAIAVRVLCDVRWRNGPTRFIVDAKTLTLVRADRAVFRWIVADVGDLHAKPWGRGAQLIVRANGRSAALFQIRAKDPVRTEALVPILWDAMRSTQALAAPLPRVLPPALPKTIPSPSSSVLTLNYQSHLPIAVPQWTQIAVFSHTAEWHAAKRELDSAGILCLLGPDETSGSAESRLLVPNAIAGRARWLLNHAKEPVDPEICPRCGTIGKRSSLVSQWIRAAMHPFEPMLLWLGWRECGSCGERWKSSA